MTAADEPALFPLDAETDAELEHQLCEEHSGLCDRARVLHERLAEFDRVHRAPLADELNAVCDAASEVYDRLERLRSRRRAMTEEDEGQP